MKNLPVLSSRRTGLAAAAALAFSALSRSNAAQAQADAASPMCCGNGPPDTQHYGLGMQVQLISSAAADRSYEFTNQVTGAEKKKNWWVFAVGDGIVVGHYINLGGGTGTLLVFPVLTPVVATAYRVQSGFSLRLIWPIGTTPIFYTRPFAPGE